MMISRGSGARRAIGATRRAIREKGVVMTRKDVR